MDASDPSATNVEEYMDGTAGWRTDLYATEGTLISHAESIELFKRLGVKMTPDLSDRTLGRRNVRRDKPPVYQSAARS